MKNKKVTIVKSISESNQQFRDIYKTYFDRLFAYAFQVSGSFDMAKDIVSEVFYQLLNANRNFNGIKNIQAYLYKSVKNQSIKAISVDPLAFESTEHVEQMNFVETINPQDLLVGKELEQVVKSLVDDLPPHCQLVFRMIREEGLTYEEASRKLGIAPKTVKNHLFLALGKIRSGLTEHFKDTPIIKLISNISCLLLASVYIL